MRNFFNKIFGPTDEEIMAGLKGKELNQYEARVVTVRIFAKLALVGALLASVLVASIIFRNYKYPQPSCNSDQALVYIYTQDNLHSQKICMTFDEIAQLVNENQL